MFLLLEIGIGKERMKKIPAVILHIYTKLVIAAGFGIFYIDSTKALGTYFKALVGANSNPMTDTVTKTVLRNNAYILIFVVLFAMPVVPKIKELCMKKKTSAVIIQSAGVVCNIAILLTSSILLVNTTNNPFLYFRF